MIINKKRKTSVIAYILVVCMIMGLLPNTVFAEEEQTFICEKELHSHDEGCYDEYENLICEKEEHEHTNECLSESAKGEEKQNNDQLPDSDKQQPNTDNNEQDDKQGQNSDNNEGQNTNNDTTDNDEKNDNSDKESDDINNNSEDDSDADDSDTNNNAPDNDNTNDEQQEEPQAETQKSLFKVAQQRAVAKNCTGDHTNWTPITQNDFNNGTLPLQGEGNYYLEQNGNIISSCAITITGEDTNITLCLRGVSLQGNSSNSVITVTDGATLTLCDCGTGSGNSVISGGKSQQGGGVSVTDGATFNMYGGTIMTNESDNGGGVYVQGTQTKFNMHGGTITNNKAKYIISSGEHCGGGVYLYEGATFNMNGGEISENKSDNGAGVYVGNGCEFTMTDGTIFHNQANNGGGVCVNGGTFTMKGGIIGDETRNASNSAIYAGGGVYLDNGSEFIMDKGKIVGNSAGDSNFAGPGDGGGVYVNGSKFNMNGGEISDNIAYCTDDGNGNVIGGTGGGVYLNFAKDSNNNIIPAIFTMTGGTIDRNTAYSDGGGVYVNGSKFNMNGGKISGNIVYSTDDGGGGGAGVYVAADENDNTKSTFTMTGGTIDGNFADTYGGGVLVYDSDFIIPENSTGVISNNLAGSGGGGVYVNGQQGKFTMNGGTIGSILEPEQEYSNLSFYGGGVYVDASEFEMTGGKIIGNQATYDESNNFGGSGAGVFANGSIFTMTGGTIGGTTEAERNTADFAGGGVYVNGTTFTMENGKIQNNTAGYGAGIFANNDFTMDNCTISGNLAGFNGGGIYLNEGYECTMTASEINENVSNLGAGIYVDGGTFKMNSGKITGNIVTDVAVEANGGGVYINETGTFEVSGSASVTGNTLDDATTPNNVYLPTGKFITVTGQLSEFSEDKKIGVTTEDVPTETPFVTVKVADGGGTSSYTITEAESAKFKSDNIEYKAVFDNTNDTVVLRIVPKYTVTFELDDGTGTFATQTVSEGEKATKPQTDPTRTGYSFVGWFAENATEAFDFENTEITENIILTAHWTQNPVVTFETNGGSAIDNQIVENGGKAIKPQIDPTKTGFVFAGWYTDEACTAEYNFETPVTESFTLYALWKEKVTITFETNDGSAVTPMDVIKGEAVTELPIPTKAGYTFVGWFVDEELETEYVITEPVTEDITLYAKWEKNTSTTPRKYSISGVVKYQNGVVIENAVVKANAVSAVTDSQGKYTLFGLSAGNYDVVATITVDGSEKTASKRVSVISGNINNADIIFAIDDVSTEIKVPSGSTSGEINADDIVVKGLDEEAKKHTETDASVKLTLTIQSQETDDTEEAKRAIQKVAKQSKLEGFDVSLEKAVTKDGVTTTTTLNETDTILEIIVPFDFSDKQNVSVYRYLDGKASELEKLSSEPTTLQDGTFFIDEEHIHIYMNKMAYYAIVYDKKAEDKPKTVKNGRTGSWVDDEKDQTTDDIRKTDDTNNNTNTTVTTPVIEIHYNNCPKDNHCPLTKFVDIDVKQWYHDGVHYCVENGLMSGTSTTKFDPNEKATRAMIVAILWRIENQPMVSDTMKFTDVGENAYYKDAVLWAVNAGIISGYNEKTFAPNDSITREQMASILYRYTQYKGKDVSTQNTVLNFEDVNDISSYAIEAMKWACGTGIINGTSSTTLSPKGNATRAQIAQMLKVYLNQ